MKLQKIIGNNEQKLQFNLQHRKRIPHHLTKDKPIKLNASAALRGAAVLRKQQYNHAKSIFHFGFGDGDSSQYARWRKVEEDKVKEKQYADVHRKWLEGKLTHEKAILAQQKKVKENRALVQEYIKQKEELLKKHRESQNVKKAEQVALVNKTKDFRTYVQAAKNKIQCGNQKIAQNVNIKTGELQNHAAEFARQQLMKKSLLTQKMHPQENLITKSGKCFDGTTSGRWYGMSLIETNERLHLLRENKLKEIEARKDLILKKKREKNESVASALQLANEYRKEIEDATKKRNEKKVDEMRLLDQKTTCSSLLRQLRQDLHKIKKERLNLAKEIQFSQEKKVDTKSEKRMLENNRWEHIDKRKERNCRLALQSLNI